MATADWESCPDPISGGEFFLGVFLFVGTLVSFLPQHIKLIMKKSHIGLSIFKAAIGSATATCAVLYYAALEYNNTFYCCPNATQCIGNMLPFLQLLMIVMCDQAIMMLYLYYFDVRGLQKLGFNANTIWIETRWVFIVTITVQAVLLTVFFAITLSAGFGSSATNLFGTILIGMASLGQLIQWGPQIYRTWVLKRVGSLSLPMIFLQAGGAALTAFFFSTTNPWYIWLPFVFASVLLTVLLVESIYYMRLEQREAAAALAGASPSGKPLLTAAADMS